MKSLLVFTYDDDDDPKQNWKISESYKRQKEVRTESKSMKKYKKRIVKERRRGRESQPEEMGSRLLHLIPFPVVDREYVHIQRYIEKPEKERDMHALDKKGRKRYKRKTREMLAPKRILNAWTHYTISILSVFLSVSPFFYHEDLFVFFTLECSPFVFLLIILLHSLSLSLSSPFLFSHVLI